MTATTDLTSRFAFLTEADRLKAVDRANVLMNRSRQENTAEHCWHVALYAMVFEASDRIISMILLHDLVEIDAGDQPAYLDHDAAALQVLEERAARRIFSLLPSGQRAAFLALWQEFEAGQTADAIFARRMDHIQPLFQVVMAPEPVPEHLDIARQMMVDGRISRFRTEWPEAMAAAQGFLDGGAPEGELASRLAFLAEADRLKSVNRASPLGDMSRRENSAEHSWHLALYALALADQAGNRVNIGRVIRMLILHDLVEIDVGDVPLHSDNGTAHDSAEIQAAESAAAHRIFGFLPKAQGAGFLALWQEFEDSETPDAVFAKSLDRMQPVMQNIVSGGGSWIEYDVTYDQLVERVGKRIERGAPDLWHWLDERARVFFGA